ncbi:MAG: hypothetical protein U9N81_01090 [Bacillota bacterium]|nr:hypothetical protein [Bacillota bacterium]
MLNYHFEILQVHALKRHKLAGTRDYETKVVIHKDEKIVYDGTINVRRNKEGVFPDVDAINDKALTPSIRKELSKKLKEYIKKAK